MNDERDATIEELTEINMQLEAERDQLREKLDDTERRLYALEDAINDESAERIVHYTTKKACKRAKRWRKISRMMNRIIVVLLILCVVCGIIYAIIEATDAYNKQYKYAIFNGETIEIVYSASLDNGAMVQFIDTNGVSYKVAAENVTLMSDHP